MEQLIDRLLDMHKSGKIESITIYNETIPDVSEDQFITEKPTGALTWIIKTKA